MKEAIILIEQQNLMDQTMSITISHFGETTITGSPSDLLHNDLLVHKMKKTDLFRLSFLGGIEHEEARIKRIQLVRNKK